MVYSVDDKITEKGSILLLNPFSQCCANIQIRGTQRSRIDTKRELNRAGQHGTEQKSNKENEKTLCLKLHISFLLSHQRSKNESHGNKHK